MLKEKFKSALYHCIPEKIAIGLICDDIRMDKLVFQDVPVKYRANKEVAMKSISRHGETLQYASAEIQNDIDIIIEVISKRPADFEWANTRFKTDKQTALMLLEKNGTILKTLSSVLKKDKDIAIAAINQNSEAFLDLDDIFKYSKDFILEILQKKSSCFRYIPISLQQDEEVILTAIKMDEVYYRYRSTAELDTVQFAIKAIFANKRVLSNLSITTSTHAQIKWLRRNIDNINPEHKEYIKDTFLKYPNAFLYPDDMIKALMLGTPEDFLIMAHYAISKHDKTKNTKPEFDEDIMFIPD